MKRGGLHPHPLGQERRSERTSSTMWRSTDPATGEIVTPARAARTPCSLRLFGDVLQVNDGALQAMRYRWVGHDATVQVVHHVNKLLSW